MGSLAQPEDAASVLEQFTHDIANIPAEITHLMEEIQAKDLQLQAFKDEIHKRELQLQKWVRVNGGHVQNPKEEAFSKTINDCYDKCEILQAEKLGLSEKAAIVLDRQIKRLDIGLRGLAQTEQFPSDWAGPSLLTPSSTATPASVAAAAGRGGLNGGSAAQVSTATTNVGSTGGAPNVANAAQRLLAQNTVTPVTTARSTREGSSDGGNKRRRLNQSLGTLPASSSHLRQSSLGPGTPKAGTPVPAGVAAITASNNASSSRAGSAQPGNRPANHKKGTQSVAAANTPTTSTGGSSRPKAPPPTNKPKSRSRPKKSSQRSRRTPADSIESDAESELSASQVLAGVEEDDGDDTIYCICQKVSFGDMVGCDNDNCPYQWFHYKCVGVTEEPSGEWLCPDCKALPRNKIKKS